MVETARDISHLKTVERQLTAVREDALAASRAKSEFLSSMSHEIRTPMNAILGMSELLGETTLDSQQKKFLGVTQNNGNALLALINDILDLARVESGRLNLKKTGFELDHLTDKVGESLAVRAHAKGLELVTRIAPGGPNNLIGDPLRLRQVLINLVGNAIKFTARGEITIRITNTADAGAAPDQLHFATNDTGIGIPRKKSPKSFPRSRKRIPRWPGATAAADSDLRSSGAWSK